MAEQDEPGIELGISLTLNLTLGTTFTLFGGRVKILKCHARFSAFIIFLGLCKAHVVSFI